mgnify:CR=1 FL=1
MRAALLPLLVSFTKTSNNQIAAVDVLLAWWYGLALGAERFEHLTRYRRDPLLPRLLGLPRFPSPDTVQRFFRRFTYRRTTEVSEALMRLSLQSLRPTLLGHTLDLDSTVFCRYGAQAGSLKGHNPLKHGRPSHHPLVAWLSERRRLLWATLRAGHAGTANGVREFLAQALSMLPAGHRIGLVRADAGFFVTAFLTALEARDLPYIIVARLTPLVRKLVIHRIPEADWQPVTAPLGSTRDLDRFGSEQDPASERCAGYGGDARHDRQGRASGADNRCEGLIMRMASRVTWLGHENLVAPFVFGRD